MDESRFERQLEFNRRFFADRGLDLREMSAVDRAKWTKEFILHVEGELHELLRETNWKMHHVSSSPTVRGNVLEEWVDCLKFILGLANVWGFSFEEIAEEFDRKTAVVEYRYGMEQRLRAVSPTSGRIVAVDIDGVLNDYPESFLAWARKNVKGAMIAESKTHLRKIFGPRRYQEAKDAYRASGAKRDQGVRDGAKELLDGIRAAGGTVILLSKRPYWRFSRIYADTLEWLDKNGLRYDAVLFHREKHRKIVDDFPHLLAMVEDDPAVSREVLAVGKPVLLVEGELNLGVEVAGATRVASPDEALPIIETMIKET